MKIICDLDNVIADFDKACRAFIKDRYGVDASREQITEWNHDFGPVTYNAAARAFFEDDARTLAVPMVKGSRYPLEMIAREHEIVICTARPVALLPITAEWLRRRNVPHEMLVSAVAYGGKSMIPGGQLLIDDNPTILEGWVETGRPALRFVWPWNRPIDSPLVKDVTSWADILAYFYPPPRES